MLNELRRLTLEEQRALREAIDRSLSTPPSPPTEEQFERELFESGFLERIPPPPSDAHDFEDEKPINIQGKPLSETVIEERR
jgi:hypothetical protein